MASSVHQGPWVFTTTDERKVQFWINPTEEKVHGMVYQIAQDGILRWHFLSESQLYSVDNCESVPVRGERIAQPFFNLSLQHKMGVLSRTDLGAIANITESGGRVSLPPGIKEIGRINFMVP